MKRISKIMIVIASIITIFAMMVIQCFAWQNTNQSLYDVVTYGEASYNTTPIKSIYIQTPRGAQLSDGYITRSIQHQNVYTVRGKSNFRAEGKVLSGYVTEVQNNWNSIQFGDSDINSRVEDETKRQYGYICSRNDDITYPNTFAKGNEIGNAYDEFRYKTGANLNYERRRIAYIYEFGDFVIDKSFLENSNALMIENQYTDYDGLGTRAEIEISYNLTIKDEYGINENINIHEQWDKTNEMMNSSLLINGVYYDGYYARFSIFDHIYSNIPSYARDKIQINQLKISIGENWEDPSDIYSNRADQSILTCTYYRPYAEGFKNSDGVNTQAEPYNTSNPIEILSIDYRNRAEFNKGGADLNLNGFEQLGGTIGDTVQGVFDVEIFPNISIWTLLMIPFSLGVVFALLRYFAGG